MSSDLQAGIIRFPHVEGIIDRGSFELSDGAIVNVRETDDDLGLEHCEGTDVWELPVVRYVGAKEIDFGVTALPIFTTRRFIQWMIEVPEDGDIREPRDLVGKRIIQPYQGNTDTIWTKGIVEDDYGVDLSGVSWFSIKPERVPEHEAPEGVVCLNKMDNAAMDGLMLDGTVDAAFSSGHGNDTGKGIRRLWPNPELEAAEWYRSARFFPILHLLVVRDSALAEHPTLANDLYRVFDEAKQEALEKWDFGASLPDDRRSGALWSGFPGAQWGGADRSYLPKDPLPYGIHLEENRANLERIIRYAHAQGALHRLHSLEELFAPVEY